MGSKQLGESTLRRATLGHVFDSGPLSWGWAAAERHCILRLLKGAGAAGRHRRLAKPPPPPFPVLVASSSSCFLSLLGEHMLPGWKRILAESSLLTWVSTLAFIDSEEVGALVSSTLPRAVRRLPGIAGWNGSRELLQNSQSFPVHLRAVCPGSPSCSAQHTGKP